MPAPQAAVVQPRMSAYAEASKRVCKVFEQTSPLAKGLWIDEAYLDVRGLSGFLHPLRSSGCRALAR